MVTSKSALRRLPSSLLLFLVCIRLHSATRSSASVELIQPASHGKSVIHYEALAKPALAKEHVANNVLEPVASDAEGQVGTALSGRQLQSSRAIAVRTPRSWGDNQHHVDKTVRATDFEAGMSLVASPHVDDGQVGVLAADAVSFAVVQILGSLSSPYAGRMQRWSNRWRRESPNVEPQVCRSSLFLLDLSNPSEVLVCWQLQALLGCCCGLWALSARVSYPNPIAPHLSALPCATFT